jgi:hypothetical protein
MDAQEKRIEKILGSECERNSKNALKFLNHLQKNIESACILTGVEDFPWEEPYIMGGLSQKKYEKLKKNNPSFKDQFELIELLPPEDEEHEIIGKVKRNTDGKTFIIGLSWLEAIDKKSLNYQLLHDYSVWHINY